MKHITVTLIFFYLLFYSCKTTNKTGMNNTFNQDIEFLRKHVNTIVLTDGAFGRIAVVPEYQGRVMTSTIGSDDGESFGWINKELITNGKKLEKFNPYGGEDRFWLGPEGGQFSLFHTPGKPFNLDNWFVADPIDKIPYDITEQTDSSVSFKSSFKISNYSGTQFNVGVTRKINMISSGEAAKILGLGDMNHLKIVGYESENHITNLGDSAWKKETGLISIWVLGMFNPSVNATIIVPFYQGDEESFGPVVNDSYFTKVPANRLHISNGVILFTGDGNYRSKIGLNWKRAKDVIGSYDEDRFALTVVQYNKPEEEQPYVKAMWEVMENPYNGDVINSYNDGPATPGAKPMGPFYELESSSPVKELKPGEELVHIHRTFHIQGTEFELNKVCEKVFGIRLQVVRDSF